MDPLAIIKSTYETGAFWAFAEGLNVQADDLKKFDLKHPIVKAALRARSLSQVTDYAPTAVSAKAGGEPDFDGEMGPAMEQMLQAHRCPIPDHVPPPGVSFTFDDEDLQKVVERMQRDGAAPALGDGNWKGCWDVGPFHSASVRVNSNGLPGFLRSHFIAVLKRVRDAYAQLGLLLHFINKESEHDMLTGDPWEGSHYNIEFSFVGRSRGWIGLAVVGQGETCSTNIWCKYLSTYRPQNILSEWTTLVKHEIGHNCGMQHFSGRNNVMNPSLITGLPPEWSERDASTPWLKRRFGGEPVPLDGPGPEPDPEPEPEGLEKRVAQLETGFGSLVQSHDDLQVRDAIQQAQLDWSVREIEKLKGGAT